MCAEFQRLEVFSYDLSVGFHNPRFLSESGRPAFAAAADLELAAINQDGTVVRFTVPQSSGQVSVVPTARLTPVTWHYRGSTLNDAVPFTLSW